jgi:DNA repair exonuclease SbcCD ATPase subunit
LRIVRFFAENVKRIKVVEVVPQKDASMVVIGGQNDAGKSSCLDAIEMALAGARSHPAEPLRKGAKSGRVVLDLGDIIVTRTFTRGDTALVVESKAGKKFAGPQAMLDKLYGELTFDPLEFERQDVKKQAETLRKLVGLDFSDLDKVREKLYADRTLENKTLGMLQASLAGIERYEDAPEAEVSVQALSAELEAAEAISRQAQEAARAAAERHQALGAAKASREGAEAEVQRLERQLAAAKERAEQLQVAEDAALTALQAAQAAAMAAERLVPDTAPLHASLKAAEGLNEKVRANASYAAQEAALVEQRRSCEDLTHQIEAVDEEKARRLADAAYPVPGLSMSEAGDVLFSGIPFEQASTSDRIRVSVAMGLALHPKLKVLLVRDGSLIGEKKLQVIEEMVREAGAQLWLEMMQEEPSGRTTVFIEDGMVAAKKKEKASVGAGKTEATK